MIRLPGGESSGYHMEYKISLYSLRGYSTLEPKKTGFPAETKRDSISCTYANGLSLRFVCSTKG